MRAYHLALLALCLHFNPCSSAQTAVQQECPSAKQLVKSLRQVEKMFAAHEASYQKNLRALRKKIGALHNSTAAVFKAAVAAPCPKPEAPAFGSRLGWVFGVGHEVHFLCKPGYELIGPRTRKCLESLQWSGRQPQCRRLKVTGSSNASSSSPPPFLFPNPTTTSPLPPRNSSVTTSPAASSVRPSHCTHLQGSTRCTCDVGFTISGLDNAVCTDVDECRLFPLAQPGRLCVHRCVNTPGSFRCVCPSGYRLATDSRTCTDVDECERRSHNCTAAQMCVNTFGGFRCVAVRCPVLQNATYIKTSPVHCERNPCVLGDKGCTLAPNSVSYHFLSLVSNMAAPRLLFRVSAARVLGDTLRFGLVGGRGQAHFSVRRAGRQSGTLLLMAPVVGPTTLEAEVEMSELERGRLLGRYLTRVTVFVSQYDF